MENNKTLIENPIQDKINQLKALADVLRNYNSTCPMSDDSINATGRIFCVPMSNLGKFLYFCLLIRQLLGW